MINHKYKIIFVHIPKCAGTSISHLLFGTNQLKWKEPNYDVHYGWCPKRKLHLQHATPQQLLELDLINEKTWNEYFKFTVVRNPWSRALSGYRWLRKTKKIRDSFENYITKSGKYREVLTDKSKKTYRGDHLNKQVDYVDLQGIKGFDRILYFEHVEEEIHSLLKEMSIDYQSLPQLQKSKKTKKHYSLFYNEDKKAIVDKYYAEDIQQLGYQFIDKKSTRKIFDWLK